MEPIWNLGDVENYLNTLKIGNMKGAVEHTKLVITDIISNKQGLSWVKLSRLANGGSFHFVLRDLGGNRNPETLENLSIHNIRNTVVIMDLSVTKG